MRIRLVRFAGRRQGLRHRWRDEGRRPEAMSRVRRPKRPKESVTLREKKRLLFPGQRKAGRAESL